MHQPETAESAVEASGGAHLDPHHPLLPPGAGEALLVPPFRDEAQQGPPSRWPLPPPTMSHLPPTLFRHEAWPLPPTTGPHLPPALFSPFFEQARAAEPYPPPSPQPEVNEAAAADSTAGEPPEAPPATVAAPPSAPEPHQPRDEDQAPSSTAAGRRRGAQLTGPGVFGTIYHCVVGAVRDMAAAHPFTSRALERRFWREVAHR